MESLSPAISLLGYVVLAGITVKAECSYWNSHSDTYKQISQAGL